MELLRCDHLSVSYDRHMALHEINFAVEQGDFLCIVGENGSGKSTLMKAMLRLLPLQSGQIDYAPQLSRTQIGYLPQQTPVQKDFPAFVREVVLSGCLSRRGLRPFYTRSDRMLAEEKMQLLDIQQLANRCYRELSGGQQQRVLLARALCATGQLLCLDEPITGLDPVATEEFYQLLQRLHQQNGLTIVMVTHDIHAAVRYASKILHLETTQLFYGKLTDYLHSDAYASWHCCTHHDR